MTNEISARPREEVLAYLDRLRDTMNACIEAGMATEGTLPGGLGVRRRAKALHERLLAQSTGPAAAMDDADPTSPWQPTSAPAIEALVLMRDPTAVAASRKRRTPSSSAPGMKRS